MIANLTEGPRCEESEICVIIIKFDKNKINNLKEVNNKDNINNWNVNNINKHT